MWPYTDEEAAWLAAPIIEAAAAEDSLHDSDRLDPTAAWNGA
jgi:hypothetical protein